MEIPTPGPEAAGEAWCAVCGEAVLPSSALKCESCHAPYHVDCWHFVGTCSIFGCGSARSYQGAAPAAASPAPGALLHIDEDTRLPLAATLKPYVLGWARKMAVRAADTPKTLAAGFAGGGLAVAAMLVFERAFGYLYTGGLSGQRWVAAGTALLYGLVAPYLAPYELERPGRTGLVASLAFYLLFFRGPRGNLGLIAALLALILATSCFAEFFLGARTRLGAALGGFGVLLRMGVAYLAMMAALVVFHPQTWFGGPPLISVQYLELATWSLLAVLAGQSALETGKEEMKKKQIAAHQQH